MTSNTEKNTHSETGFKRELEKSSSRYRNCTLSNEASTRLNGSKRLTTIAATRRHYDVIMALSVPALVVTVGMEFIPLQDPLDGWKANYGVWLRFVVGNFCIGLGFIFQVKQLVPGLGLTKVKILSITLAASCCGLACMIATANCWVFPIPFSLVLIIVPYMTSLALCFLAGIGKRPFQLNPNLWHQLLKQVYIILAQALLAFVYIAFGAVYTWLPPTRQTGFILVLPVLKAIMQNVVAWSSKHMEEYVPGITVFSVELFNALYVAKCVQKANSIFTYAAIVSINIAESVIAFRSIQEKFAGLDMLKTQSRQQGLIHAVVETCQQLDVLAPREGSFIRLRVPIALWLSRKNSEILGRLSSIRPLESMLRSVIPWNADQIREPNHAVPTSQHKPRAIMSDTSTPAMSVAVKHSTTNFESSILANTSWSNNH